MNKTDRDILTYYLKKLASSREITDKSLYTAIFEVLSPAEARLVTTQFTDYKRFYPSKVHKIAWGLEQLENTPEFDKLHALLGRALNAKKQIHSKIQELGKVFSLSICEEEVLQVYYLYKLCPDFKDAARYGQNDHRIFALLGYKYAQIDLCLAEESPLKKYGLMGYDEISSAALSYITGSSASLLEHTASRREAKYTLESFPVDKKVVQSLVNLINNVPKAKILLHGACGTGKTQFAASLANACGKSAYFLKEDRDSEFALSAASPERDIVVIDEADDSFNERMYAREQKKGGVNKELDRAKCQCIYISNSIAGVDPSVLRRFHYILEFKPLKSGERVKAWKANITELSEFLSSKEIGSISEEYDLPLGIVANSAKAAVQMAENRRQRKHEFLSLLKSHYTKQHRKAISVKQFDASYLNMSVPVESIIYHAKQYVSGNYMGKKRFSMLFHGMPGTGKSEFAKYLAKLMKFDAQVVLGSDIISMWVGGTEQNICNAFENAQGKVLIFDEADSMLFSRDDARHSWERTQVNEFLAQMDNFKGVLICTTNHLHTLDSAAIRRFDRKVEFLPSLQNQIQKIVSTYFPAMDFSSYGKEISALRGLTPGDIAVVAGRFWDKAKETDIIEALAEELIYKSPRQKIVGFDI